MPSNSNSPTSKTPVTDDIEILAEESTTEPLLAAPTNLAADESTSVKIKIAAPLILFTGGLGVFLETHLHSLYKQTLNTELAGNVNTWNPLWTGVTVFGENKTCSEFFTNWTNIDDMPCADLISGFPVQLTASFNASCMIFYNNYCSFYNAITTHYSEGMENALIMDDVFIAVASAGLIATVLEYAPTRYKPSNAIHAVKNAVTGCFSSLFNRSSIPAEARNPFASVDSYGTVAITETPANRR